MQANKHEETQRVNMLNPGCWIAHALAEQELRGEAMSIEFLRATLEAAPTFPHAWTRADGQDFAAMYAGRAS